MTSASRAVSAMSGSSPARSKAAGSDATVAVQVGINNTADDTIDITLGDLTAATLTVDTASVDLSTSAGASTAITNIDTAIASVSSYKADFGAVDNRLNSALNSIESFEQTTAAAESRVKDADFGKETAVLAQNQILQQAGVSVLGQAKNINQAALSLLQ